MGCHIIQQLGDQKLIFQEKSLIYKYRIRLFFNLLNTRNNCATHTALDSLPKMW